jgi:L-fuconolactonase
MKIDAHQHFWKYNPDEYGWIDDEMKVLKRDFLPDDLSPALKLAGFDGSIVVQARQCLDETRWLLNLAGRNDFIKGVVGWVDLCSPEIEVQLAEFSRNPKLVGVRHVVHDEPDDDFMARSDFQYGISLLSKYNLTYDLLIFPKHLSLATELVKKFPDQKFVLDHIAKPQIKNKRLSPWKDNIRGLALLPNVYCKLSGMVTESDWKQWTSADFTPYLDIVVDAFGTERLLIGSDWPVCTLAGSYAEVMQIVIEYIARLDSAQQQLILGQNAIRLYSRNYSDNL